MSKEIKAFVILIGVIAGFSVIGILFYLFPSVMGWIALTMFGILFLSIIYSISLAFLRDDP